jgi:hypothetical protein
MGFNSRVRAVRAHKELGGAAHATGLCRDRARLLYHLVLVNWGCIAFPHFRNRRCDRDRRENRRVKYRGRAVMLCPAPVKVTDVRT